MANKTCPGCQEGCGPRTQVCPKCGHQFVAKSSASVANATAQPKKPAAPIVKPAAPITAPSATSGVYAPRGIPPVRPTGYTADGFPNGYDDVVIADWAVAIKDHGTQNGVNYLPQAIKYWARYFWNINDKPVFTQVCQAIDKALGVQPVVAQTPA